MKDDEAILIYDQFDLWKIDPEGKKVPVNITHQYGRENHVQLRRIDFKNDPIKIIQDDDKFILSAFNLKTKESGFFALELKTGNLRKLIMSPKAYYFPLPDDNSDFSGFHDLFLPIKAKNAEMYLLKPMSVLEFPNIQVTRNFSNFTSVTNLAPQTDYNWYTNELIKWHLPNGKLAEGILFKPENFDPKKKYPVIFYYYETMAGELNVFINPALSEGRLNIPLFVSNGYLVFVPNVYYKPGFPGESAYSSVSSAAEYLGHMTWVDKSKMGLQGHSFGGFETEYIVTRTNLFKAAAPSSGMTSMINEYNRFDGGRDQYYCENGQARMGASLWQKQGLYLRNSPILSADKINTPLFIMHNKGDGVVNFRYSGELYSALLRLSRKAWMISYKDEGHIISGYYNKLDYSIRLSQFFDYYLKGTYPPKWMTTSMPLFSELNSGNIKEGLELDVTGKKP